MKIVGISTIGTYPNHIAWGVASLYHVCDQFLIINGGFDVEDLNKGCDVPLEREKHQLKDIDIAGKIVQVKSGWDKVNGISLKREEAGRGRNMTQAVQYAAKKMGADVVVKFDSDNIIDPDSISRDMVEKLLTEAPDIGRRFGQYELEGDFYHFGNMPSWAPEDDQNWPSSNDAPQIYRPAPTDWYVGGGAPVVSAHIIPHQRFISYHVRNVAPHGVDPYEYFYKRFWYHTYAPWTTGELKDEKLKTYEDVVKMAKEKAERAANIDVSKLNKIGSNNDPKAPPAVIPRVITIKNPKKWIEETLND